jgi:hypothetical protein
MKARRCRLNLIPSDYFDKEKTPPECRSYTVSILLHRSLTHLSRGTHRGTLRSVEIGELAGRAERRQAAHAGCDQIVAQTPQHLGADFPSVSTARPDRERRRGISHGIEPRGITMFHVIAEPRKMYSREASFGRCPPCGDPDQDAERIPRLLQAVQRGGGLEGAVAERNFKFANLRLWSRLLPI